jgi:uncharacterized membrane protein YgdD (TMEM256/DUF423 family)
MAGISGASAVLLGAVGAHALVNSSDSMKDIWKTAAHYHLIHSVALASCALHLTGKKRNWVCGLYTVGMICFSGACYGIVLMDQKKPLSHVAPVGGILLTLGWVALAVM